ncbi:MAG: aminoglycoside phosphotransferase family protein [Bacteroidetes bacterium]|nr:aminoglycoside phosphotransferase family protein [Bacteroidota bacterium]
MAEVDHLKLKNVFSAFQAEASFNSASRIGSGHINDTFRITTADPRQSYVLQRINSSIFKNIPGLMRNIGIVTRHLEKKILSGDPNAGSFSVLRLIPAIDGELYFHDPAGEYWRLYNFIEGSRSYDIVESPELAREGGRAFGLFQYLTSDIPAEELAETIPHFHDLEKRLRRFHDTVQEDPVKRAREVQKEIEFIEERASGMMLIRELGSLGKIPLRVTHNDTKFNNILFSDDNRAMGIVDLDTVMPGYILYDFGDAIRTGANPAAEDEKDLSKIHIDLELFDAYAKGYLETAGHFLNPIEISHLAFSARFMTYIIGLRFFTDHIDGDRYYKITFPGHNLQRARAQFKLLESMEENAGKMEEIVKQAISH